MIRVSVTGRDEYSRLQDEIYKTMITMRESREEAEKRGGRIWRRA